MERACGDVVRRGQPKRLRPRGRRRRSWGDRVARCASLARDVVNGNAASQPTWAQPLQDGAGHHGTPLALCPGVRAFLAAAMLVACAPPQVGVDGGPADAGSIDAGGQDLRAQAMAELRDAILPLDQWRFQLDPGDAGVAAGWAAVGHDDSGWAGIAAGRTWEDQGYPGYDGVAWYRIAITIPASWAGSRVQLHAFGIDDEYDLWVDGAHVVHHGERPDRSVWGWQTRADVTAYLQPGATAVLAIRVVDWGGGGGLWRRTELRRSVPLAPYRELLPAPIVGDHPEWEALYWDAWQLALDKVSFGTADNGLVDAYMDEGFNEQIYQWDSSFIALFGRYGVRLFPVMPTLDNFYGKQRADGYIQRVYSETDGGQLLEPTDDEPGVNPPLFAWVEHDYWRFTGDGSRLAAVHPVLTRYHRWLRDHLRAPEGRGLYYQTHLGSGMDNTPRGDSARAAWIDMSAQQALAALSLARIAAAVDPDSASTWQAEHGELAAAINALSWHDGDGTYHDLQRDGTPTRVRHLGAYWTLLAEVAPPERAARMVAALRDPFHFGRPHPFPALAASDPAYDPAGHYWRGGVWAPTNYMVVRGLRGIGESELARAAAAAHLGHLAAVMAGPPADLAAIAPEERDGDYRTLWECYAPEADAPATRWDAQYLSRQDFVGWTGLGPIAMLIEDVLGIEVIGAEDRIVWTLTRTDRHGVDRLPLGAGTVSLLASARPDPDDPIALRISSDRPFTLELRRPGREPEVRALPAGTTELIIP